MARENRTDRANTALADFVAPKESLLADYVGAFAVTAGIGEAEALARHIDKTDDYGRIMLKALADRLAEALRRAHARARAARALGLRAQGEALQRGADRRGLPRHPPGARLSGSARPHREGHHLPPARCRARRPASSSPRATPCGRAPPSRASTSRTRKATISASARSSATRWRTTRGARAGRSTEAERWLAPVLNYDTKLARSEAA